MVFLASVVEELVVEGACIAVAVVAPSVGADAVLAVAVVLEAVVLDMVAVAHIGLVAVEEPYSAGRVDVSVPVAVDNYFDSQSVAVD